MLLLGIDAGTSSIKVSVVNAETGAVIRAVQYPETETPILAPQPGWAEQSPDTWWENVQQAILLAHRSSAYNPSDIGAIGIAYQMHGLVMVDKNQRVLRNAIIWCDSRAIPFGEKAFRKIGPKRALSHLLNSPGNFTAAKLAWVKKHEPAIYKQAYRIMLPGDFISMKLTGEINSSISALSEGIFWDFRKQRISRDVLEALALREDLLPAVQPVFSGHGQITPAIAGSLNLRPGIPVSYKAGDQPNNALSLNVLNPGEVAATAGTSGVIYGVSDSLAYDPQSRINSFAHVNHMPEEPRIGVLLCINGTGIMNSWVRNNLASGIGYAEMNASAAAVPVGSNGMRVFPFGNGAERMLNNRLPGAQIRNIDLNLHTPAHIFRAGQEGIACAFRYGLDIMRKCGITPKVIRAGRANLFLSDVFMEAFVNTCNVPVELYDTDGSTGAAIGAGLGAGVYRNAKEAFRHQKVLRLVKPSQAKKYEKVYRQWAHDLERLLDQ